jgi:hypothetical protein
MVCLFITGIHKCEAFHALGNIVYLMFILLTHYVFGYDKLFLYIA